MTGISNHAHALKGVSANIAATQLSSLCHKLEMQARNGEIMDLDQQIETITKVSERTLDALKRIK